MNKLQEIFTAWGISFNPNQDQSKLAAKRIEVCNSCEHKDETLGVNRCKVCGCALKAKVFSPVLGACPEGKWDEIDNITNQEIVMEEELKEQENKQKTILVQIASYRDPEIIPTIKHCIDRAQYPERLSFVIINQYNFVEDKFSDLSEFKTDPRFKIVDIDYSTSKGACWARNLANDHYSGEYFSLQLDSHMRFIENWDTELINIWESLENDKAVITGYPPNYDPSQTEDQWYKVPQICNVYTFDGKYPISRPMNLPEFEKLTHPVRGYHISAAFLFARGHYTKTVKYDPEFYFAGEELAMAVRTFTHGYDLYYSHKTIVYHYYARYDEAKHWGDHKDWGTLNRTAHDRLDCLLGRNNDFELGEYGVGSERTLQQYIDYSGVDFVRNIVYLDTKDGKEPPIDNLEEKWEYEYLKFNDTVLLNYNNLELPEDLRFIALIIKDRFGIAVHREDVTSEKYPDLKDKTLTEFKFEFEYLKNKQEPRTILLWPYSESTGWTESKEYRLKVKENEN
jgi:glycosyltransferase involved in cell wall biosynthesis